MIILESILEFRNHLQQNKSLYAIFDLGYGSFDLHVLERCVPTTISWDLERRPTPPPVRPAEHYTVIVQPPPSLPPDASKNESAEAEDIVIEDDNVVASTKDVAPSTEETTSEENTATRTDSAQPTTAIQKRDRSEELADLVIKKPKLERVRAGLESELEKMHALLEKADADCSDNYDRTRPQDVNAAMRAMLGEWENELGASEKLLAIADYEEDKKEEKHHFHDWNGDRLLDVVDNTGQTGRLDSACLVYQNGQQNQRHDWIGKVYSGTLGSDILRSNITHQLLDFDVLRIHLYEAGVLAR